MIYTTILKENLKRHKGSLIGVFILIFIISLSLSTVLSVWINSGSYVRGEMSRLGFGDITAWVAGKPDVEKLATEITDLGAVEKTGLQNLIYSDYSIKGKASDSQGQLVVYDLKQYPYKIFNDDLSGYRESETSLSQGEIYISPSLASMFDVKLGDEIHFSIARQAPSKVFVVKGYFEDPFMGSSMIGMKSFLIGGQDSTQIAQMIGDAGIDALADTGAMLHIFKEKESTLSISEFNGMLNEQTELSSYTSFVHSNDSILGFMLILQNAFTGFLLAFVVVLLAVSMIVLGHSISSSIEQDYVNMGILKTLGFTSGVLRKIQMLQYLVGIFGGMLLGLLLSQELIVMIDRMTVTTTGLLIPTDLQMGLCALSFAAIVCLLIGFIYVKTIKIGRITPLRAIHKDVPEVQFATKRILAIHQKWLSFWIAMRQLATGEKQYIGVGIVTILLVFFASLVGRMDSWLEADGAGLMDAFNPAKHDVGVQIMGDLSITEIEDTISSYSAILDQYQLAMPSIAVNGVDYTANVISEPERFHILQGRTCRNDNEIVLTEFAASDLDVGVGDTVTVSVQTGSKEYMVAGIYQCANDMGANFGISKEGYDQIGVENPAMWCTHYFLSEPSQKQTILQALESTYGKAVHVHENAWPGLYGIISAMQILMIFMYGIVIIFILVVVALTGSKILSMEQKDLLIYKALGFSTGRLRFTFSFRFGIVSIIGSAIGVFLSAIFTDSLVALLLKMCGISNFSSHPGLLRMTLPAAVVVGLVIGFSYMASKKIKAVDLVTLIAE